MSVAELPIRIDRERIAEFCRTRGIRRLSLFGSVLRDDFDPGRSDLDFLVEFEDLGWKGASSRYFGLLHGLEDLLGRRIDLVERKAVRNPLFLQVASRKLDVLYAA